MEKVNVKDIIGTTRAISPRDGTKAYNFVANELQQHHALHINFEGMEAVSTQFCNKFIGNLYMNFDKTLLDSLIHINGIDKDHIWNFEIEEAIYFATHEEARNEHNTNLRNLLND